MAGTPVGYSLDTKSGTAASATSQTALDSSGWSINFGSGSLSATANRSTASIPTWVWYAVGIGALVWVTKRK